MPQPVFILLCILHTLGFIGVVLHVVATLRLRKHLRPRDDIDHGTLPPLTLWRSIKPGVPQLSEKLVALVESSRENDQILLGTATGSEELVVCEAIRARYPQRKITAIACMPGLAANPKISAFLQMAPHAIHEDWLLTDSEAQITTDFIEGIRKEWAASKAPAITAGYRFTGAGKQAQIFDTLPVITTLWPGLMLAGKIAFTLGACTGVRKSDVVALGGWEAFGDELAEDYQLGHRLTKNGKSIVLSRHVLDLEADPLTPKEMWRHQHRVAVTYRVTAGARALGLPLMYCFPFLLIAHHVTMWVTFHTAFQSFSRPNLFVMLIPMGILMTLTLPWLACIFHNARLLGVPLRAIPFAVLSTFVEFLCWMASWFTPFAFWGGKWRRIDARGRFIER